MEIKANLHRDQISIGSLDDGMEKGYLNDFHLQPKTQHEYFRH